MRILQLSSAEHFGGGERYFADLANALAMRGHNVHAVLRPQSPITAALNEIPSEAITTLTLRNALDAPAARALSRLVKKKRIEIVHAHMGRDYSLACYAARQNPGVGLFVTRHVLFPLNPLYRIPFTYVDRVIAVSEAVARSLRSQRLVPEEKIRIIPNGVLLSRFAGPKDNIARNRLCQSLGIPEASLLVGTVAELKELKGHEEFLRAGSVVARNFANSHFIIAGADPSRRQEYRATLKLMVAELDLVGRVHLLGWVEHPAPLLKALDLFVSASRSESFGLAIAEAMASGTAVVATDTEGAREIIQDGETGLRAPISDIAALAARISELLSDRDMRERLSKNALAIVRTRYSLEKMVETTELLYRECLDGPVRVRRFSRQE
ncbi:MAG TPA: glycosyltransferase family 4 protein [Pyrinomonadaceae bacterium]|nr:glycosyltransferase family 4 protein [Pyrinomonadaceae bacterium]